MYFKSNLGEENLLFGEFDATFEAARECATPSATGQNLCLNHKFFRNRVYLNKKLRILTLKSTLKKLNSVIIVT